LLGIANDSNFAFMIHPRPPVSGIEAVEAVGEYGTDPPHPRAMVSKSAAQVPLGKKRMR
jgi:hypothetical protein